MTRELRHVPPGDLTPYPDNARTHPEAQVARLADMIREYGFTNPILVDRDGVIIAGHGRHEAAVKAGLDTVPTITLDLTQEQARAYRIADNQLALEGEWDADLLAREFAALDAIDFDLSLTGLGADDVNAILADTSEIEEEPTPEPPAEPETKPGDLWVLGGHRLICGDSTDPDVVARVLDGATPNLMVTDPPYGVEYDAAWRDKINYAPGRARGKVENDDRADWSAAWRLSPANVVYCWCPPGSDFIEHGLALRASGFVQRSTLVWAKHGFPIGRGHYHWKHEACIYSVRKGATAGWIGDRKQNTVWEIDKPRKSETGHSTQKPLECMERPIRNHSGDVYDPFLGSGTTLIAAERQRRRCFAIEIDPGYCDVAVTRWEKHTGGKATRLPNGGLRGNRTT